MTFSPPYFDDLVNEIAAKSFGKHVVRNGEFHDANLGPPVFPESVEEFASHIRRTLLNPQTVAAQLSPDRFGFYDARANTVVILTPAAKKPGTCYRPRDGGTTFNDMLNDARLDKGGRRPRAQAGGLYALFPEWRGKLVAEDVEAVPRQQPKCP